MKIMPEVLACLIVIMMFVISPQGASASRETVQGLEYEVPIEVAILNNQSQIWNCVNHSNGEYDKLLDEYNITCMMHYVEDGMRNCDPKHYGLYDKYRSIVKIIENDCNNDVKDREYVMNEESDKRTTEQFKAELEEQSKDMKKCYELQVKMNKQWEADAMKSCPNYKKCYEEPDSFYKPKRDKALSLWWKYGLLLNACYHRENPKQNPERKK